MADPVTGTFSGLAEGGTLEDPAGFVKRINELMMALSGK